MTDSLHDTMALKVEIAVANDEIERLRANNRVLRGENATLRTTAQSLCKWYEGQEGLREALEGLVVWADSVEGRPAHGRHWDIARAALAHHDKATPLWGPLHDCVGEE